MSCGGVFPPSVQLRLQCAALAAQAVGVETDDGADVVAAARELFSFVAGDVDFEAFDERASPRAQDRREEQRERQRILDSPLMALIGLREPVVEILEMHGIETVGQLAQVDDGWVGAHTRTQGSGVPGALVLAERSLQVWGLRLRMTADEVRDWLIHGPGGADHQQLSNN